MALFTFFGNNTTSTLRVRKGLGMVGFGTIDYDGKEAILTKMPPTLRSCTAAPGDGHTHAGSVTVRVTACAKTAGEFDLSDQARVDCPDCIREMFHRAGDHVSRTFPIGVMTCPSRADA